MDAKGHEFCRVWAWCSRGRCGGPEGRRHCRIASR